MALDPALFRDFKDVRRGDRVRFTWTNRHREIVQGSGVVRLIWLGVEEMCEVVTPRGESFHICRALGDTVEKLDA